MADPMPDYETDPCAMARWLRAQYYALLGGGDAIKIRFADREVTYSTANIDRLEALLLRFEGLCAKSSGQTPRRYAGRLGAYR